MSTIDYDPRTALVVVDMQNDFADAEGSLYVVGGDEIVETVNAEIAAARVAGALVVYTMDWHPAETPHFAAFGGVWPIHCVMGTWGAELHPDLIVDGPMVKTGSAGEDGYSGFTMRDPVTGEDTQTVLHELLRERGIERVVVVGLALDYCVRATAEDALRLGYEVTLVPDATRPVELEPGDGDRALAALEAAGAGVATAG